MTRGFDYGEGKTREQEADDSMAIVGIGCLSLFVFLVVLVLLWWWL